MFEGKISCPLCKIKASHSFIKNNYQIYLCRKCNYEFIQIDDSVKHISSVYGDDYFEKGESGYPDYLNNKDSLIKSGEKYSNILSNFITPGTMFDIGAAAGFLLKGFINKGWKGNGIEPNNKMTEYANKTLGLNVKCGTIEEYESDKKYDLITMIQVISHFYDIKKALLNTSKLLKKNGYLLIETWNKDSISAKIFVKKWHEYNPPSVVRWFSKASLNNYLSGFGFELVIQKNSIKWIYGKYARNIIKYNMGEKESKNIFMKTVNLIPNNFKFPYLSDDLFWTLYKKQTDF